LNVVKEIEEERKPEIKLDERMEISKKKSKMLMNFVAEDKKIGQSEESLIVLRIIWKMFLNGEWNDIERMKVLYKVHNGALKCLKRIENRINNPENKAVNLKFYYDKGAGEDEPKVETLQVLYLRREVDNLITRIDRDNEIINEDTIRKDENGV
jgi:hypothetical protein